MKRFLAATETTAALFLLLIALLTAANVLARALFSVQIPDWYDGSRMVQGIALFWGFALATYYGSHICVDIVWEYLNVENRRWMDLFATLVTVLFLAPLAWMVWIKTGDSGGQGTSDLRLPLQWFYAVAAIGVTVAVVLGVARLVLLGLRRSALLQPRRIGTEGDVPHGS